MAFNYEDLLKQEEAREQGDGLVYAGKYLKDNGNDLLIRLPYKSLAEVDVANVHKVQINGKDREVVCLREDVNDALSVCPLCNSGNTPKAKVFLKGITYLTDDKGMMQVVPFVFERPIKFLSKIANLLNVYPNLNEILIQIKRNGVAKDPKTTYELVPLVGSPIYTPEAYPIKFELLDGIDVIKRSAMVKDYNDIGEFLRTGAFPVKQATTNASVGQTPTVPQGTYPSPQYSAPQYGATQYGANPVPNYQAPQYNVPSPSPVNQAPLPQTNGAPTGIPPYQAPTPQDAIAQGEANPFPNGRPKRIY